MNTNNSNENEEDDNDEGSFKQVCASLMSLSNSLAQQQAGETLVSFGEGTAKRWLNARSIRMVSLKADQTVDMETMRAEANGLFTVMVDELPVTEPLPADHAEQVRDEVAEALNRILQPPR